MITFFANERQRQPLYIFAIEVVLYSSCVPRPHDVTCNDELKLEKRGINFRFNSLNSESWSLPLDDTVNK